MDLRRFYEGKEFELYKELGVHAVRGGFCFRTFAPNAGAVSVIGDFTGWKDLPMHRVLDGNFWEVTVKGVKKGSLYKYRIYGPDWKMTEHSDPFARFSELRPNTASVVYEPYTCFFDDLEWMRNRKVCMDRPLNIYEMHMGSWRRKEGEPWLDYEQAAEQLIPWLKENGYTHAELMPLAEHPCDESWGYQITGFFSPTARYGTPDQLRSFVNRMHKAGIGVIMDFVPVHFAANGDALMKYDGTALFEYPETDPMGYSEWGSCNFNHGKGTVRSFLQSAADYWLSEFHFDGLRMDAVSNLIYYQGRKENGVNQQAVDFLKGMNQGLKERHSSVILMAEDSSSYPGVTKATWDGGLGFDYKWDMGWMNDTLDYFRTGAAYRTDAYHKLTFSMMYFYNENYVMALSHDEVVHGKATILQKMNGNYEEKFAQARALYMYMFAHPGKKLNFMGNEIGQLREWNEKREQDWFLTKYPIHDEFNRFMKKLNRVYADNPAFWEADYKRGGFEWLDCHQENRCLYAFERIGSGQRILCVFNFSDRFQKEFTLKMKGKYLVRLLGSEDEDTQAKHPEYLENLRIEKEKVTLDLPPYTVRFYEIFDLAPIRPDGKKVKKQEKAAEKKRSGQTVPEEKAALRKPAE